MKMKHRARPGQDGKTSLERQIQYTINREDMLPVQREVLWKWDRVSEKNDGMSLSARISQLSVISLLARKIRKPFKKMTKKDIEEYIFGLELSASSMDTHKIYIRKFFKWLYQKKDYPDNVAWIKFQKDKKRKLPEDILKPDEIKGTINAAGDNLRNRALVSVLYESGCRPSELVMLKQKDVTLDQYGAVLMVHGKTGDRRVRLIDSTPDLILWLNNHPNRGEDKWLFVHERSREKQLELKGVYLIVRKLARVAGIDYKRVYPYLYRHTRATHLAKDFTDSELKIMQGWSGSSRMPEVYIHLSGADIDKKRLEKAGLITQDEARKDDDILKARVCPRCKETNPSTARFCYKCGMALDLKTAQEIEDKDAGFMLELMDLMNREPRLLDILKGVSTVKENQ